MAARLTAYIVVAIVGATLIAGLIVGAQRDDRDGPVDLIVFNGKVYAPEAGSGLAQALAVRGNRILRVGTNREINRLRQPETVVVDALGGAVLPGFNDAHLHFLSGGLSVDRIDLRDAVTLDQIEARIQAFAAEHPRRPWVQGRGWDDESAAAGLATRQALDEIVPDRPARIVSADGRASLVNSRALALAGITRRTADPKNGVIVKDSRTGEPTGVLTASAQALVTRVVPRPTREDRLDAIRAGVEEAHRHGVTSVQTAGGAAADLSLYDEARKAGDLRVRVYSALSIDASATEKDLDALDEARAGYPDHPLFKTGAVKLDLDGPADERAAAAPAAAGSRARRPMAPFTRQALNRLVTSIDRRGWQIIVRASEEDAVRTALDAFEEAARANPAPARGRRHRLEHAGEIASADLSRLGRLGIVASLQPAHDGDDPLALVRRLVDRPGRVAMGSDWPAAPLDPLLGLERVVNEAPEPPNGNQDAPAPPLEAAIDAYTSAAAYASFEEHRKGTLAPGMLADLVVLSEDIFSERPRNLRDAVVDVTVFDGRIVYQRPRRTTTN
jgi:predicted amidohydrolase YtcJ